MRAKKNSPLRNIIKWSIFATNVVVIVLLLLSPLAWKISPLRTTVFSYIGLGFGAILFANVAYLLLWLYFKKWKLAAISLVVMLISYKPITTYCPLHILPRRTTDKSIKIVSQNINAFQNQNKKSAKERPTLDYLVEEDADIILLQEYQVGKQGKVALTQTDINAILENYPYRKIVPLAFSNKTATYGLACFSKYPIKDTQQIKFDNSTNGAAIFTIEINDKLYSVANVHLESNKITAEDKALYADFVKNNGTADFEQVSENIRTRMGSGFRKRVKQVAKIKAELAKQETAGTIICGDFNDTPISYTYAQMKKGMKDAYPQSGFGPGITYNKDFFWFRIDHIMYSPNLKLEKAKIDWKRHSDHFPIKAWIRLEQ